MTDKIFLQFSTTSLILRREKANLTKFLPSQGQFLTAAIFKRLKILMNFRVRNRTIGA